MNFTMLQEMGIHETVDEVIYINHSSTQKFFRKKMLSITFLHEFG